MRTIILAHILYLLTLHADVVFAGVSVYFSQTCRSKHLEGVCEKCLRTQQRDLVGPPGSRASTDVYDAVVDRARASRQGQVRASYMHQQVAKRNSEQTSVNPSTTVVRIGPGCYNGSRRDRSTA